MATAQKDKPKHTSSKHSLFVWLSSSSELIGICIAVSIVVAGSFIVFGYNGSRKAQQNKHATKEKEKPKKIEKVKKVKIDLTNASIKLSENRTDIQKRLKRAARTLQATRQFDATKDTNQLYAASLGSGEIAASDLKNVTERRITELWQAQNAVEANDALPQVLKDQIAEEVQIKIGRIDRIGKRIPIAGSPSALNNAYRTIQQQKIYSCFLPNVTRETVTEDLRVLMNEQNAFSQELRNVASDMRKQEIKTDQLTRLLQDRTRRLSQIDSALSVLHQARMQAEETNCSTNPPFSILPISRQFTEIGDLDQQIRQLVERMLREKGVYRDTEKKKSVATPSPRMKEQKRDKREEKTKKKKNAKSEKAPTAKPTLEEEATPVPTEPVEEVTTPTPTVEPTRTPLAKPDFAALGLPSPQISEATAFKEAIDANERAKWAVDALLAAEKTAQDKGIDVIPYLTTGWVWFENGSASWPDPYEINCNDNRPGHVSEASVICTVSNFQIAGYQAIARRQDYVTMFQKFYKDDQVDDVVKRVAADSKNAIRSAWNYNDEGQQKGLVSKFGSSLSSATIKDISPDCDIYLEKCQFLTLLIGKDPNMVISLNSFAVSDSDLVAALKSGSCGYGYICAAEKQILSNMVAALYLLDGGTL